METCISKTHKRMSAYVELQEINLLMLHPKYCSDFFSVELQLMRMTFEESYDHTSMDIFITEMGIYDYSNHPYTSDPKEVGPQSTIGKKSEFKRKIISMTTPKKIEEEKAMRNTIARSFYRRTGVGSREPEFTMTFKFRSYMPDLKCPL